MNNPPNPYSAPSAASTNHANRPNRRGIFGWSPWFVLAGGVWFGRTQMLPVYEDFGIPLTTVTQFFVHPLFPPIVVVTGVGFLGAVTLTREPRKRRLLQTISLAATIGLGTLAIYGFFRPLVVTIHSLD